jgi:hypothetical protein
MDAPVAITRRRIDHFLVASGAVLCLVLAAAGALLTWGTTFSSDYVSRELSSQQIFFPAKAALETEGRTDLFGYAGQQVTSGKDAEAYASYIDHHLDGVANGMSYAELGGVERAAKAEVTAAVDAGKSEADIAALRTTAAGITAQRDTLFRGETLRGLLLSTYAWDTIGTISGIAAIVSFIAAAIMLVLVTLGIVHLRRHHNAAP